MAGIFGILQFKKHFNIKNACQYLLTGNRQDFQQPGNIIFEPDNSFGLGYTFRDFYSDEKWPLLSQDKQYWFQIFGNMILPNGSYLGSKNFNSEFLQNFLRKGDEYLQLIDGEYLFVIFDRESKTLRIYNDIFGNFALHYLISYRYIIFSSNISAIGKLVGGLTLDTNGLLEYLGLGQTLNGRTLFSNIKRLKPASFLIYSQTDRREIQYYKPNYRMCGNKENLDKLKDIFRTSVKNRIKNNEVMAALTGGLDSRAIWSTICDLNNTVDIKALTHGIPNCRDINIARRIADLLKIEHLNFLLDDDFIKKLPDYWQKVTIMGEGCISINSAHSLAYWEFCSKHGRIVLDGHGGALYRRQFMKAAQNYLKINHEFVNNFFSIIKKPLMKSQLISDNIKREIIKTTLKSLETYFDSIHKISNIGAKIDLYYLQQISALKYSVAANVQQNFVGVHHPFLSPYLFNEVQNLPEIFQKKNRMHKYIIKSNFPRLEGVMVDNMGLPAPYFRFEILRYFPMVYEKILEKIYYATSISWLQELSLKKFVTDYNTFIKLNIKIAKEILLCNNSTFNNLVHREILEKRIRTFSEGDFSFGDELIHLLSFKLFLDNFS